MNMNKKKLPKAVTRTATQMRNAGVTDKVGSKAETIPAVAPQADGNAAQRQTQANAIVERYANFSALGGVVPLPLVNVATVTVIILQMVKKLCQLYGMPYEQGRARALVVGLAGGAVPTTASAVTTSTLVYFIPGVNLLGMAVSSVTASLCARAIGRRFVEHFETGASLTDFPVIDRRRPVTAAAS
jgi:uncharacterized protein (DUF697 family)